MDVLTPYKEAIEAVCGVGGGDIRLCYQCGRCTGICPWNEVRSFPVRRIIHQAQLGAVDFESEDIWSCVTCRACVQHCPRRVAITDVMRALRRTVFDLGVARVPDSLRLSLKNISGVGNPQGEDKGRRKEWAKDLEVKPFSPGSWLYFPCCVSAYDPKAKGIARAMAKILQKVEVDFGILGGEEVCCGESARKAGDENLFHSLAENNLLTFSQNGVGKILVNSPHCFHTFKNEYPKSNGKWEVVHYTQFLAQLIKSGNLKFGKAINKRVAYHDSCYLGRYNGLYDEPREVLKAIPGLELVEMANSREDALCCGGGGGRIWMETRKGERFSDLRVEQAVAVGAEVLAVACPYCFLMLEDSALTTEKSDRLVVKDIAELVEEAI